MNAVAELVEPYSDDPEVDAILRAAVDKVDAQAGEARATLVGLSISLHTVADAMVPIGELAEDVRAQRAERYDHRVEVLPAPGRYFAVGSHGQIGTVIGWRWVSHPFRAADPIPPVIADPVVQWEGTGGAHEHSGLGGNGSPVRVFADEVAARAASRELIEVRNQRRAQRVTTTDEGGAG